MSKEKPVLFKPFLIDAIVNGNSFDLNDGHGAQTFFKEQTRRNYKLGNVGDLLWVKEATYIDPTRKVWYRRDSHLDPKFFEGIKWKSPLFMRKEHARVWLEITDVREEKLGDISESDCFKEGIVCVGERTLTITLPVYHWDKNSKIENCYDMPRKAFFDLIKFIQKERFSFLNMPIWVHDFKVVAK